jgi:hypothetical protein
MVNVMKAEKRKTKLFATPAEGAAVIATPLISSAGTASDLAIVLNLVMISNLPMLIEVASANG